MTNADRDADEPLLQLRRDHSRLVRLQQLAEQLAAEDSEALLWLLREYEKMAAILLDY